MKTYTIDELNASTKTRMDYQEEHRKMVEHMRAEAPWRDPTAEINAQPIENFGVHDAATNNVNLGKSRWNVARKSDPFWKDGAVEPTEDSDEQNLTDS